MIFTNLDDRSRSAGRGLKPRSEDEGVSIQSWYWDDLSGSCLIGDALELHHITRIRWGDTCYAIFHVLTKHIDIGTPTCSIEIVHENASRMDDCRSGKSSDENCRDLRIRTFSLNSHDACRIVDSDASCIDDVPVLVTPTNDKVVV